MFYRLNGSKSAAMFQHLVESLPRRVGAVIAAKGNQLHINVHDFEMTCCVFGEQFSCYVLDWLEDCGLEQRISQGLL
jgi:hypothetical protein